MTSLFFLLASLTAANLDAPRTYDDCVAAVEAAPSAGRDYAESWSAEGGGKAAKHCAAIAALALGSPLSAGAMLLDLAKAETDPGAAARLSLQAAEAFMEGNARPQAFAALRQTYEAAPDAPDVHMAAATIYATGEEWAGGILALTALARHADLSADAYALRAQAYLEQEDMQAAATDVTHALTLDPLLVDALVLRGRLLEAGVALP